MTDAEFEAYVRGRLSRMYRSSDNRTYRPRYDGEQQEIETLGAIEEMRETRRMVDLLNSLLALNAVCTVDAFTISDAEHGVQPELLNNVFRLAVEGKLWVGE